MRKKCYICKLYVQIDSAEQQGYMYDCKNKKFYHYECLLEDLLDKQEKKKRQKLTQMEIEDRLSKQKQDGLKIINEMLDEERLYCFIYNYYGLVSIPKSFIYSIEKVLNGEYKGLLKGIPIEDLLDMWQRKKNELDKIYEYNKRKGKDLDLSARLSYDLAVLVGKYDSYLEWKQKEIVSQEMQKAVMLEATTNNVRLENIAVKKEENNDDFLNLANIIDEI